MSVGITTSIPPMQSAPADERKGLPSASGLERIALCNGSWLLEKDLPPEPESEDASSGTRIHQAIAMGDFSQLTAEEKDTAERCVYQRDELIRDLEMDINEGIMLVEQRLWLMSRDLKPLMSGQMDFVLINDKRALLVDYKTGRNEAETATKNHQLMAGAVLLRDHFNVESVVVAIVQPWVSGKPIAVEYDLHSMELGRLEIEELLKRANDPKSKRTPSLEACRYCRAKASCSEARRELVSVANVQALETLTGDQLAELLEKVPIVEKVCDAITAEAKKRLQADPASIEGWQLKAGAERRTIADAQKAFAKAGIPADKFASCCTVKVGELEKVFAEVHNIPKKNAKEALAVTLGDCLEVKQSADTLVRVKS